MVLEQVKISLSGLEFRASTMKNSSKSINIFPVMHVASEPFFEKIFELCRNSDIVLLEGMEFKENSNLGFSYAQDINILYNRIMSLYYKIMPDFLNLKRQSMLYDLIKENHNFKFVDVDAGHSKFILPYEKVATISLGLLEEMIDCSVAKDFSALYDKYFKFYSNIALNLDKSLNNSQMFRNDKITKDIFDISSDYDKISLIYGIGHAFYFEHFFSSKGYVLENYQWLTALPLKNYGA